MKKNLLFILFFLIIVSCDGPLEREYSESFHAEETLYQPIHEFEEDIAEIPYQHQLVRCHDIDQDLCCVWEFESKHKICKEEWCIRGNALTWTYDKSSCL